MTILHFSPSTFPPKVFLPASSAGIVLSGVHLLVFLPAFKVIAVSAEACDDCNLLPPKNGIAPSYAPGLMPHRGNSYSSEGGCFRISPSIGSDFLMSCRMIDDPLYARNRCHLLLR